MKETQGCRPKLVTQRTYEIEIPFDIRYPPAPGEDVGDRVTTPSVIEIAIVQEDQDDPTMSMGMSARVEQMIRSRNLWEVFKNEVDAVWKAWDERKP